MIPTFFMYLWDAGLILLFMSYNLFEKNLYFFHMTTLIYILCNVLSTK
jgi:hypothetical protein